jgi:outer membrane lipoprotein SlyB
MTVRKISVLAAASVLALVSACSSSPTRSVSQTQQPRYEQPISGQYGYVRSIEVVSSEARGSGAGAVLGAIIGGALGNQVGGGTGKAVATGAGIIGGAVIGDRIEKQRGDDVYRVTVRFDNGVVSTFDYERIDSLRIGDRVMYDGRNLRMA